MTTGALGIQQYTRDQVRSPVVTYQRLMATNYPNRTGPDQIIPLAPAAQSDKALFVSFLGGNDEAFGTLYERHNRPLFYYCLKLVRDTLAAEDLTQTAWEKLIHLRTDPVQIDNVPGFLVRMLRNLSLDYLKRQKFQTSLDGVPQHAAMKSHELNDREELVLECLNAMGLDSKELLILHYYSGYSFEEIANILGKKTNAIWTRASRARAELKTLLEKRLKSEARVERRFGGNR